MVYRTEEAKFNAVVADIKEKNDLGQPVLVGTVSVEKSEVLSTALRKAGVKHEVLNAKHHDREAAIVAEAGRKVQSRLRPTWPDAVRTSCSEVTRSSEPLPHWPLAGCPRSRHPKNTKRRGQKL